MLLVLAGNQKQADYFIREELKVPPSSAKVISSIEHLQGISNAIIILYGTYYDRPDYLSLVDLANALRCFNVTMVNSREFLLGRSEYGAGASTSPSRETRRNDQEVPS